jgi:hypothetical protein
MAKQAEHKWSFKAGMRARSYNWKSSARAIARLKSTVSEIKAVNRTDPVAAAEGVIALAERIWPAFEHIDTSSGALGSAVNGTLVALIPILIAAPADEATRAKWLDRLRQAIQDDGVDYLFPFSEHFGEIASFPKLMNEHADLDLDIIRHAWSDWERFSYVTTSTLTLSCLLEAERYDELTEVLALQKSRSWSDERFAAQALLRQGQDDEALAFAQIMLDAGGQSYNYAEICKFCEDILVRQGKADDAYHRFGLPTAAGNTYLSMWRSLFKRYPDRDPRGILEDLMGLYDAKGKWFATAKTAGFLDIALDCAADTAVEPATLIRAARDFTSKDPTFSSNVALQAIAHLLAGRGYEAIPSDLDAAASHLLAATNKLGQVGWALQALRRLEATPLPHADELMMLRLRAKIVIFENAVV